MQQAGYQTIHVGKWHIGDDSAQAGFDLNIGGTKWGHPINGYFSPYRIPGFEDGPEGEYLTERLARDTVNAINDLDAGRPFLLSMQFYSPHTPIQAKAEKIAHFEANRPTSFHSDPVYAAMISHLDDAVGEILTAPGTRSDIPVSGLDFFPTFLELAGITPPDGHETDGDSLVPMLKGGPALPKERELFW